MDMGFNITINSTSDMSVLLLEELLLMPGYTPLLLRSRLYQNTGTDTILYKIHFVKWHWTYAKLLY